MDPDKEAKERAKRPVAATKKGSQRSAQDQAARLDNRIAQNRKNYNRAADDEAAKKSGRRPDASTIVMKKAPAKVGSSGRQELGRMETDAAVKSRAKSTPATTPGAYTVSAGQTELASMERDAAAKVRSADAEAKSRAVAGRTELGRMEQDAAAKARARPRVSGTSNKQSLPTDLNQLEADIASKARARPARSSTTTPGARDQLENMEEAVIAKAGTVTKTVVSGNQLNQLEQDVVTKHNIRNSSSAPAPIPSTHDDLRRLEERIAQKTGTIPLAREEDVPEQRPEDVNPAEDDMPAEQAPPADANKFNGVNPEALASALNTGKLDVSGNNLVSALERTLDKHGRRRDAGGDAGYFDEEADRLAVAVAVRDGDDEENIPAAVEFDPDAKPPIYKNRRFRLYGLLGCVVLLVLGAGLVFGLSILDGNDDSAPTESPTEYRESIGIQAQFELLVGTEKLNDPSTPHYRAMQWIILEDPRQLTADDPLLIQRYLHVLFYFSTIRDRPWLSCNPPVGTEDTLCLWQQLISVFPHEYRGVPTTRWLTGEHECQWAGVFCDEFNQTRGLQMSAQNMTGTLPEEVALFPFLQSIDLSWNSFTGTLPDVYGTMKHLLNFELHYNELTGSIPDSWWDFLNLQRVNWAANDLTGTLPSRIAEMRDVKGFFIYDNLLTGTIPTEIGSLDLLTYARFQRNFFSGSIPTELGNLAELHELWMHRLDINGPIPNQIGNLRDMRDLRFQFSSLEGRIPDGLWALHKMRRLDLYDTKLSGTISSQIGKMTGLDTLRLREAEFYGTIPTELGLLTGLDEVWLHGNNFSGSIPDELCELRGPYTLEVITADCLGNPDPAVDCRFGCCTLCCDQATGECSS